jgi:hypothetical protein
MTPKEMQTLLQAHNVAFTAKDVPHGRQFRLERLKSHEIPVGTYDQPSANSDA